MAGPQDWGAIPADEPKSGPASWGALPIAEEPSAGPTSSNMSAADATLKLTPQERALYQRHLTNLTGPGGVDNPNGSRSTLFQMSVEHAGKTYNVPTVWDGKILKPDDAIKRVQAEGWDKFPAYANEDEAEARYGKMHDFMERDTADYFSAKNGPEPVPQSFLHRIATGLMVGGAADASPEELRQKGFEDFNVPANVAQHFKAGVDRLKKGIADAHEPGNGPPGLSGVLAPGADIGMGAFQAVTSPLSAIFQAIGGAGEKASGGLLNNEAIQDALMLSDGAPARISRVRNGVEQVIGELPKAADFENSATAIHPNVRLTPEERGIVEQNLRDLWQERGIHPAEAAHDAQTDAFLKGDLTAKNLEPPDRSDIPPVQGTPAPQGTPRTELAKTGEAHIDKILDSEPTKQVIDSPVVDREHTVPYTAGGSVPLENPTVFIDKRFPKSFTIDGVTFDPADPFVVHENVEQHVMEMLTKGGMDSQIAYKVAHFEFAEKAEGAWYAAHGIDQAKAEAAYAPYMAEIQKSAAGPRHPGLQLPSGLSFKSGPSKEMGATYLGDDIAEHEIHIVDRDGKSHYRIQVQDVSKSPETQGQWGVSYVKNLSREHSGLATALYQEAAKYVEGRGGHLVAGFNANDLSKPVLAKLKDAGLATPTSIAGHEAYEIHSQPSDPSVPPNLYKRPYPHDDPSAAHNEPIAEPKPTAAEIGQAKAILESQEAGGALQAGGADVTRDMPDLATQPPRPAGSLAAKGREAVGKLLGLADSLKAMADPMSVGGKPFMVIAKDAMNSVRRIDFEHLQADQFITRNFDLEQQVAMFDRLDEESVAIQLGESREHQGLVTLTPGERSAVDFLQGHSQAAWQHVRDVGIVEGDGLPAYAPRMVLAVSAGADSAGPRALNELGRNVYTRTAQMLQRKHLMAEDTEAAAKAMVAKQMTAKGATPEAIATAVEKVQIARNIRALPLATAGLQKAAIFREMINNLEATGKAMGSQVVAYGERPDKSWFTVAGHPAFTRWRPVMEAADTETYGAAYAARTGTELEPAKIPLLDRNGNMVFRPEPVWIHPDAAGPMKSIFSDPNGIEANAVYGALMALKGKSMSVIMNSPLIHNQVVWSKVVEAVGGREKLALGLYSRGNNIARGYLTGNGRATELIERGLSPMGPRGAMQDITSIMEEPNLEPGRSWTASVARAVPDLYDPVAGDAVGRSIDKLGDFWHNTMLWDRVRDLQFGLADHLSDHFVDRGLPRIAADRVAAHLSNMIVGSIPKEAMSSGARAIANLALFSRSYTLGNWAVIKTAFTGLPKPIMAQIERDIGPAAAGAIDQTGALAGPQFDLNKMAKTMAQKKAVSALVIGAGVFYVGKALMQHAFSIFGRDATIDDEARGYVRRYQNLMNEANDGNYLSLLNAVSRLSPTYDNEPGKEDRVHMGYAQDGTAIYGRLPVGKYGEETVGTLTHPLSVLRSKANPLPSSILDLFYNDKGFGRKIYDENWHGAAAMVKNGLAVAEHIVGRQLPEGQLEAGIDLLRGDGDPATNKLKLFGPIAGFTASPGAPGGMARGVQQSTKQAFESRFSLAWPDIRKQIQRGDEAGGRQALKDLGAPNYMINGLIRNANNPAGALRGHTLKEFYQMATPEDRARMENAR